MHLERKDTSSRAAGTSKQDNATNGLGPGWFEDPLGDDLVQYHRIKGRVYSGKSRFQSIDILDTGSYGRCLVLDSRIQSCAGDEFIYHESLVHPAMLCHPAPKSVLIAGGGEGATSRQVLMHSSVTSLTMVDIDEEVIKVCRERLPELHGGSFDDPRFQLVVGDAREYVERSRQKFDVVLLDLPEPMEGGPARYLYTQEFYRAVVDCLNPGGVVASQSDNASWGCMFAFPVIANTLKKVFPIVRPYQSHIPSFGGSWGFTFASASIDPRDIRPDLLEQRIRDRKIGDLRYYDSITHLHMFSLPAHIRARIENETRWITDAAPLEMHLPGPE
ncbi:MAG: polyamine aminopropyltransferase, partial [Chloroflexi bacterium]|nr:polyamine aminopropyltransferase [Chloroflexota bacterium]